MDNTEKNSTSTPTDGTPEAGGDSNFPTQSDQQADHDNTPQTPGDDTDGLKSIFGKKKPKESTTKWFEEGGDNTSQLAPSGALSVDGQLMSGKNKYEYNLFHARRGIAHVFINKHFDKETEQSDRPGAEQDLILYSDSFKRLGFEVKPYFDKTKEVIIDVLAKYADASHTDEDAVIFAFSTHGEQDVLAKKKGMPSNLAADIIFAKDAYISVSTLTSFLTDKRCPSMANKPRMFFFQACRGQQLAETLLVSGSGVKVESEYKLMDPNTRPVEVPLHKDFFMAYSAPPGYYSFRRSKGSRCGSWFVLALNDIIKERDENDLDIDLMELVTTLNHRMTLDPEHEFVSNMKSNPLFHKRMIVPWVASMLTKTVCFRKPRSK